MARYERERTTPVLAGDAQGAKPDPKLVVAHVGPDGKVQLGRLDLPSLTTTPPPAEADPASEDEPT